ncbi:MAG: hypothetical protein D6719_13810, partial [Candidatus Dadabacteria bacterium]
MCLPICFHNYLGNITKYLLIFSLLLVLALPKAVAEEKSYACFKDGSDSYPVIIVSDTPKRLNPRRFKAQIKKALRKNKGKFKKARLKIKSLKKLVHSGNRKGIRRYVKTTKKSFAFKDKAEIYK